jgi:urease accessory protein
MCAVTIAAASFETDVSLSRDHRIRAGAGSMAIARIGARSVVTRAFASSPLRLLMPRNHGRAAWVYTSTYGGGLVDGDALRLDVDVGANAAALLATQAATKVYRSPGGTSMTMAARVDDGGLLAVLPDPVVCFRGSVYRQDQRIDLAASASLLLTDWLTSGRHASGERWSFDRYASRLAIWIDGRRVTLDSVTLDPDDGGSVGARMGRFDVLLLSVLIGPAIVPHASAILSRMAEAPIAKRSDLIAGASEIAGGGCLLRMAGTSVEAVGRAAREHLQFVPALLGDDPWSRKW